MLMFQYFIYRSDKVINEKISKDMYKVDDLVKIKIPIHLPYIQDWGNFEKVSGQVQLKEDSYNYVSLKITRDTLFLMCVPNYEKTRLLTANVIYAKNISDHPISKRPHAPLVKRTGSDNEYRLTQNNHHFDSPVAVIENTNTDIFQNVVDPFIGVPGQPPDAIGARS